MDLGFLNNEYDVPFFFFYEISVRSVSSKDLDMNESYLKFVCILGHFQYGCCAEHIC